MRPRPLGRGERGRVGRWRARRSCFNAATASRPWRTAGPPLRQADVGQASMRPRPLGRGEQLAAVFRAISRDGLQCGHGLSAVENGTPTSAARVPGASFNAATASRPWRTPVATWCQTAPDTLQCGHGLSAVENNPPVARSRSSGRASMRPRPLGRGERSTLCPIRLHPGGFNAATASRPWRTCSRPRRPGARLVGFNAATASRPWRTGCRPGRRCSGRGFNAATASRPWRTRTPRNGPRRRTRSFNAATASRPWRTWRTRLCGGTGGRFNAATASRPWRTRLRSHLPAPRPEQLQCGHGLSAVENVNVVWTDEPPDQASMRPRPLGRGELGRASPNCAPGRSFNAATASRPWRTAAVINFDDPAVAASMRPRPLGRGERPDARCGHRRHGRFNAATASRPWRTTQCGSVTSPGTSGFNAATASRPWRTQLWGDRRMHAEWLQCGHGLSAVENAISSEAASSSGSWLQCGHGLSAVENHEALGCHHFAGLASMRPRPLGRGELGRHPETRLGGVASMRPRPLGRGEPHRHVEVAAAADASMRPRPLGRGERPDACHRGGWARASMRPRPLGRGELYFRYSPEFSGIRLQCGHGLSAVENARGGYGGGRAAGLQCGHGLSAVENAESEASPR